MARPQVRTTFVDFISLGQKKLTRDPAVFILLNAFRNQNQYCAAQLIPWILISQGEARSSGGVLLGYITGWNVLVLFKALQRNNFLVVLTISCSHLLSGLTAFSMSLFALTHDFTIHDAMFTTTRSFDDFGFHPRAVDSDPYAIEPGVQIFLV